jgi:hypothetical protein
MSRAIALLIAALALLLPGGGASAQSGARVVASVSWVEEWDPARGEWVPVAEDVAAFPASPFLPAVREASTTTTTTTTKRAHNDAVTVTETILAPEPVRYIARPQPGHAAAFGAGAGIARFGPFRVLDDRRAAIVGTTDADSPRAFAAMLAAYPGLAVLEFADAPGTSHDLANLKLGRAIRAAGLATHVPAGGSARSGAVELFLAGTRRTIDPRALFAVHSWRDELGREPADFAADAPENRLYLDYYADMGMSAEQARAFYAMTNSVPHSGALWLEGEQMARWIAPAADTAGDRAPASRALPQPAESGLRLALARSGAALAAALRGPLALHGGLAHVTAPAPRIAYALPGGGLLDGVLDSGAAFP